MKGKERQRRKRASVGKKRRTEGRKGSQVGRTLSERKQVEQAGLFTSLRESLSLPSVCSKLVFVEVSESRARSH